MGREMAQTPAQGLLWRVVQWRGSLARELGAPRGLQTGGIYEVGGEVLGRSLGGIMLNGPLSMTNGLRTGHFFQTRWRISGKWLKVDVYFSLGLGGEFPVSHLQGVGC
jgi:hypothetical protein